MADRILSSFALVTVGWLTHATSAGAAPAVDSVAAERPAAQAPARPKADTTAPGELEPKTTGSVGGITGDQPLRARDPGWQTVSYGFAEFDAIHDTTQSYGLGANNSILQRPGTFEGDHGRTQLTANNSRLGVILAAPEYRSIQAAVHAEVDFFGVAPTDVTEINLYTNPSPRLRLFYARLRTPIVDVLAGQYHGPFGWGLSGFFPNTVAFLGIPGQLFHREPQLGLSKTLTGSLLTFEVAAAALRPAQRDSQYPDLQAGLKLSLNPWKGVAAQGFAQPSTTPLSVGVSATGRRFAVTDFVTLPQDTNETNGWGVAVNAVIPVIPADSAEHRGNALTLVGEAVTGTGIADQYTLLTGGARFPTLVNPGNLFPPPIFNPNIDSGIVTYDSNQELQSIDWRSFFVGLQYYLPIDSGRVWISANYSWLDSPNLRELTPLLDQGAIIERIQYFDGNLYLALTPQTQLGLSFQRTMQTFGDGVTHHNNRSEFAFRFFF